MFIQLKYIKVLEVELSTYCNAKCPGCSRHYWGTSDKLPNLVEEHCSIHSVTKILKELLTEKDDLSDVELQLCGNLGDPMMNPDVLEGCQTWSDMGVRRIIFDTNGGLRSEQFWRDLAKIRGIYCTFSIDGLEDTNHIYRVGVNWDKLERNFVAFIESGGTAEWKFLIFNHNEHQVQEARDMAKFYGFEKFIAKMSMRPPPPEAPQEVREKDYMVSEANSLRKQAIETVTEEADIDCKALALKRIYLNAEGRIWPCCYTAQRYCKSQVNYPDEFQQNNPYLWNHYHKGFNLIEKNSLKWIFQHAVWQNLVDEWRNKNKCEYKVCWTVCKAKRWEINNHVEKEELSYVS
ncbi:MAG: hypothetical protein CMA64_00320 [Euryarchaeota archaeon]|nr:hypothetical protein [Euryarchaeota archaeon]